MDLTEYDNLVRVLAAIVRNQDRTQDDLRLSIRRLEETAHELRALVQQHSIANAQQAALIMRIVRTLDKIDEKLDRMFPPTP